MRNTLEGFYTRYRLNSSKPKKYIPVELLLDVSNLTLTLYKATQDLDIVKIQLEAAVLAAFSTADTTIKDKEEKIKDHTIKHTHIPYDNDTSETYCYHFPS